eukprot:1132777-Alexandrium_andersonii.AAC.1
MSASLVGSEMCIRDSRAANCIHVRETSRGLGSLVETPSWGCLIQGLGTVSYTHLTLPTICSV